MCLSRNLFWQFCLNFIWNLPSILLQLQLWYHTARQVFSFFFIVRFYLLKHHLYIFFYFETFLWNTFTRNNSTVKTSHPWNQFSCIRHLNFKINIALRLIYYYLSQTALPLQTSSNKTFRLRIKCNSHLYLMQNDWHYCIFLLTNCS